MDNQIFRKKTTDRLSSPEQLNDYMRVTSPGIWIVMIAVILLIAGLFMWSAVTSVDTYISGTGIADDGEITVSFKDRNTAQYVESGMRLSVGDKTTYVEYVGRHEDGSVTAVAEMSIPDGEYDAKVAYKQTQILSLLFN
ncbi:MAG: hypothetical protein IJH95_00285 [Mogibacterium sp.]|nr:hypothetical protein [Mogibacterium sp.]